MFRNIFRYFFNKPSIGTTIYCEMPGNKKKFMHFINNN